jgi:nitroreductase
MSQREHEVLTAAAQAALRAPSIFNTQPWQWRVDANTLDLYADYDRQLTATDPHGWFLLLSCGASLQHARVALAAAGWRVVVDRFPDPGHPDVLARIRLAGPAVATEADLAMAAAITTRRTDRRPFGEQPVCEAHLRDLVAAAGREGARLHDVRPNQMPMLAVAVAAAQAAQGGDEAYRRELLRWTSRPQWSFDGVPEESGVAHAARRVAVRDFVSAPGRGMSVQPGGDRGARYLIVHGGGDEPADWLRAGEAVSAVLLTAVSLGLGVAPISDVIEVEHPRTLVRGLLPGPGQPYLVVRCGHRLDAAPIAEAPRRAASEAIRGPRP